MRACRACADRLYPVFDLGPIVPSDFLRPDQPDPPAQPLTLCRCEGCGLVQLADTVDREELFRQYWYRSGVNETMRAELRNVVEQAVQIVGGVASTDRVLDIGANDGTLLSYYTDAGDPVRIAYEPAENLFLPLQAHATVVVPDFFPAPTWYRPAARSVKIVTSIAMFYDLEDPRSFVAEIDRILTGDGVWVVQMQDLAQMLQTRAFDNIVHEHLCYYSLKSFITLLDDFDLIEADVEQRAINGGSLRIYVRRKRAVDCAGDGLHAWWRSEHRWTTPDALEKFAWEAGQVRTQLQEAIAAADRLGPVDLYAASTKSSTLLQYCGLDWKILRQAAERTPEKVGLVTSATRIPIVNEHTWRADPAPTTLIGAWQFADSFIQREAEYLQGGGTFLVPLPTLRVVSHAHASTAQV